MLGYGTFGYVKEASWKGQKVAIKYIYNKKDFFKEAEQLSRVKHENIIGVYGTTLNVEKNDFGLILEFADGGNLFNCNYECFIIYNIIIYLYDFVIIFSFTCNKYAYSEIYIGSFHFLVPTMCSCCPLSTFIKYSSS